MLSVIVDREKGWINIVKGGSRMFAFTKDATSMDAMDDCVQFVGLVRKSAIIIDAIWMLLAKGELSDANGLSGSSINGRAIATITQGGA